jgi:hypothetical protein
MKEVLTQLLGSKKFLAFAVTALVVILSPLVGLFGYEVDAEKLALLVGSAATYILSQGIADHGSTAAKINAASVASMDAAHDTLAHDEPMVVAL